MKTNYFLKKQVILLVSILIGLVSHTTIAAYDNANYTPEEVRQINKETIAKEQAERLRKKQQRILKERRRQLAYNKSKAYKAHGRHMQQQHPQIAQKKTYQTYRVNRTHSTIPAWRRSASSNMARDNLNDAIFTAAKNKDLILFKQLVNEGANIHHKNFNGESALHIAASLGHLQMVQYLLSKGANVNVRTGKNWLPIHHAIRFEHPVVANYLIAHKASIGFKNTDGFSALDFASKSKNTRITAIARRYGH